MASDDIHDFDVVVVGGGPSGATTARLIAQQGWRVALVEKQSEDRFRGGESLPPQANPILRRLGLMQHLECGPHLACHGIRSLWGTEDVVDVDFVYSADGTGWHLDRNVFDRHLLTLARRSGVDVFQPAQLMHLAHDSSIWQAELKQQHRSVTLTAKFLVDASGINRVLTRRMGVPIDRWDPLVATLFTFDVSSDDSVMDSRSIIESVENGWWYSTLLPGPKRAVMFFCDSREPLRKRLGSVCEFFRAADETRFIRTHLPDADASKNADVDASRGKVLSRSAATTRPERIVGNDWLAVGDAAASIDPLSSRGLLTGLETGENAARAIGQALGGCVEGLRDYERLHSDFFRSYLVDRCRFYASETRWADRPFWSARRRINAPDGSSFVQLSEA